MAHLSKILVGIFIGILLVTTGFLSYKLYAPEKEHEPSLGIQAILKSIDAASKYEEGFQEDTDNYLTQFNENSISIIINEDEAAFIILGNHDDVFFMLYASYEERGLLKKSINLYFGDLMVWTPNGNGASIEASWHNTESYQTNYSPERFLELILEITPEDMYWLVEQVS